MRSEAPIYYVAGPPAMVKGLREMLRKAGAAGRISRTRRPAVATRQKESLSAFVCMGKRDCRALLEMVFGFSNP